MWEKTESQKGVLLNFGTLNKALVVSTDDSREDTDNVHVKTRREMHV